MADSLQKWERNVALILSAGVVALHVTAATSAGALWRDEANTAGLATLPTVGDVWNNLQYDSFPILWFLILRWTGALFGTMNDNAFRTLGFFIGVGIVTALWLNARTFGQRQPLFSLALLGMAPSLIIWGDSVRAYGFGILLILVTCALLWRFLQLPNIRRFVALAIGAIASVQALFYNSILLLAFCAGAVAVCGRRGHWKRAGQVVLIGALAAISLVPYVAMLRQARTWNALVQIPDYNFVWFFTKLSEALSPGGFWALLAWLELLLVAVFVAVRTFGRRDKKRLQEPHREVVVFWLVCLCVGVMGIFLFLTALSYLTEPWYYLALMALVGLSIDAIFGVLVQTPRDRAVRLAVVTLIAGLTIIPATHAVKVRRTNADLVASKLLLVGRPGDLVIVNPWHFGVSFDRYYRGPAAWMTLPPIAFHRFHRYDLLKEQLLVADQRMVVRPVFGRAEKALRSGDKVYVVGELLRPTNQIPAVLPPAPLPRSLWWAGTYYEQWSIDLGYFLQQHAITLTKLPVSTPRPIGDYENLTVIVAAGWRD
jgi:hypothetical protein